MVQKSGNSKEYIWGKRRNKKWIIIVIAAVVVIAGALGYIIFGFEAEKDTANQNESKSQTALTRRAIDGVYVPYDQSNYYPVAVMIENLVISRPPSNLSKANLVYEVLVEGGITRFLAIYAGQIAPSAEIGPIRSARPYYLDWVVEFNALYMHAGGSPQAMADIKKYDIFDLDQFYNSQYYWRDQERLQEVAIEHTLYSSGELISYALRDKEASENGDYNIWKFKDDVSLAERPTGEKNVIIDFSSFNYKIEYKYDRESNNYVRYQAGEIHKDRDDAEIRAKNVIVQKVKTYLVDQERLGMDVVGEGEVIVFIDGLAMTGTWEKKTREGRTMFYDESGDEVEFNAGPIWIDVIPTDRDVEYN
jgi:hypothetical protein